MSSPTTYTSKAGNLWVFELGARVDWWVRQRDRSRPSISIAEADTGGLEEWDALYPIGPWFRLKEALGLKGDLTLEWTSLAAWELSADGVPVHVFAGDDVCGDLPETVVPALLLVNNNPAAALEAILAVVEAPPSAGGAMSSQHIATPSGHGWTWVVNLDVWHWRRDLDRLPAPGIRQHDLAGLNLFDSERTLQVFDAGEAPEPDIKPGLRAADDLAKAQAGVITAAIAHQRAYEEEQRAHPTALDAAVARSHETGAALRLAELAVVAAVRGEAVYTYEPPEPHPAIARIDALFSLRLADLEQRPKDDPRPRHHRPTSAERADIALELERLTAARLNLVKAGPS